jgi:hypothetical protein
MKLRRRELIEVKSNLEMTVRERGKVMTRRRGHNIWLNLGREYLAQLIAYTSFSPLTAERNDRVRYMGVGIGGTRQIAPSIANASPLGGAVPPNAYAGTNAQVDTDPTVTVLERPVRISGGTDPYPGLVGDTWLGQVQAPAQHPTATQTTFRRVFSQLEVSYGTYLTVPLSEIGLFTHAASPGVYNNTAIAYDTFDTLSKTDAFELEVAWTIRF